VRHWDTILSGVVALIGIAMTSAGALLHMPLLFAPGSALILLGGAGLGLALGLHDVRVYPRSASRDSTAVTEKP